METPQPISVSGRITVEGQLVNPSSGSVEIQPLHPWWKFWKPAPPAIALTRATVWLVIATLLLAVMAFVQAIILATTDASTRKAANAAITSAATTQTALQTARDNFRIEQRPIIWLTNNLGSPQYVNRTDKPDGCEIAWEWHYTNYGRSPALHLTFHQLIKIEDTTGEGYGYKEPFCWSASSNE